MTKYLINPQSFKIIIGCFCILVAVITWVVMGEIIQEGETSLKNNSTINKELLKPYFFNYVVKSGYSFIFVVWALFRWIKTTRNTVNTFFENKHWIVLKASPIFTSTWVFCGYAWYSSLPITSVSANTAIYNSQCVFVFVFSVCLLHSSITLLKTISVCLSLIGIFLISFGDKNQSQGTQNESESSIKIHHSIIGYFLVVISTVLYGFTEVYFNHIRLKAQKNNETGYISLNNPVSEDNLEINSNNQQEFIQDHLISNTYEYSKFQDEKMDKKTSQNESSNKTDISSIYKMLDDIDLSLFISGVTGVVTILFGWIIIPILHWYDLETFCLPDSIKIWNVIITITLLDILFAIALVVGVNIINPLLFSIGSLLTLPASILADIVLHNYMMDFKLGILGIIAIIIGFCILTTSEYLENKSKNNHK